MKLSSKLSMSSPMRRAIDAVEMSLRAMELMDETVWIMQMIAYKYEDMLPEDSILKLKDIQNHLKDEIHETIKKRFGKEAYEKKFLEYVDKIMQARTSR